MLAWYANSVWSGLSPGGDGAARYPACSTPLSSPGSVKAYPGLALRMQVIMFIIIPAHDICMHLIATWAWVHLIPAYDV